MKHIAIYVPQFPVPSETFVICCDSMIPDTILGGIIITQLEVFNDKKTSYFFSRV